MVKDCCCERSNLCGIVYNDYGRSNGPGWRGSMSHRSLFWPLSIIFVAVVISMTALATPAQMPSTAPLLQQQCDPAYPNVYPVPCQTETAQAQAQPTSPPPAATFTPSPTNTPTPTATNGVTPTPATQAVLPTPTETRIPATATATATSTPIPGVEALECVPGAALRIEGQGPPNTALLLYFGDRAVGGTTSDSEGFYSLPLVMGAERDGVYALEVRVRGSQTVVDERSCVVPFVTPTPIDPWPFSLWPRP